MRSTQKIAGIASLLTVFGLGTANAADPLVPPPAPAPNANTIKLKVSGQVNRAVLYADNDENDEFFFVDNDNSGTRFRFVASGRLNDDVTAGATIELQFESNSTPDIRFNANSGTGGTDIGGAGAVGERIGEVWFSSATMGKLSLGQGNTASNGTSEVDLSGTDIISYSGVADSGGGLGFANTGTAAVAGTGAVLNGDGTITFAGVQPVAAVADDRVGQIFTNLDGGSRRDRIRYDTPSFAGFKASTSASQGGRWDVALRYANQYAGAKIAGAIAYQGANAVGAGNRLNGSLSILLDNGLSLTGAAGNNDNKGRKDTNFYYGKVAFTTSSVSQYGKTSFGIDYFKITDSRADGEDGTSYSAHVVQNLNPVGAQLYLSARVYQEDVRDGAATGNPDDIFIVISGARIKF